MVGLAADALALAAGMLPTPRSAALVPPSTNVASSRSRRAVALGERTRTCTCSEPATPTGSVATLACEASVLPGSGAESLSPIGVHEPHRPSTLLRTLTLTPLAAAASGKPTPTTSAPSVSRVSTLSAPAATAAEAAPVDAVPDAPLDVTCEAGIRTRSTEGLTACGAAPTVTTGTTMTVPASRVDAVTMRRILMDFRPSHDR